MQRFAFHKFITIKKKFKLEKFLNENKIDEIKCQFELTVLLHSEVHLGFFKEDCLMCNQ